MRKHLFLLSTVALISLSAIQAQDPRKIPAAVKSAFETKYPNQKPEWVKESNSYVAKFTEHGNGAIVHFNRKGQQTERGWYIEKSEMPEAAQIYLNKYYPNKNFKNVLELESTKGVRSFKARLNGRELVFDQKGVFIKKEKQRD